MALSPAKVDAIFQSHMSVVAASSQLSPDIVLAANAMVDSLRRGGKVLACGNGGSAADAQHFAAELVGRFLLDRKGIAALALTTDSSVLSSIGNDYGFEKVFERQVEALSWPGDVLLAITTSGNSANIVAAAAMARSRECKVVGLTGKTGGELAQHCHICVRVPSEITARIQEVHGVIVHALCEIVESELA